ncbi:MAG: hypothetical protein L6R41_002495 [Letrouitia leprolyta]|nr:MAG: hypothetical protein L6R41_002495 [Letrouitia leprolyta]
MLLSASYGQFAFGSVIDGDGGYIKQSPATAIRLGKIPKPLPTVIGHNAREGIGFTYPWIQNDRDFRNYARELFPKATQSLRLSLYTSIYPPIVSSPEPPYENDLDRAALVTSDVLITCNTYLLALGYDNATYNYLFNVFPGLHGGDDLHYTFGPDASTKSPTYSLRFSARYPSLRKWGTRTGRRARGQRIPSMGVEMR